MGETVSQLPPCVVEMEEFDTPCMVLKPGSDEIERFGTWSHKISDLLLGQVRAVSETEQRHT